MENKGIYLPLRKVRLEEEVEDYKRIVEGKAEELGLKGEEAQNYIEREVDSYSAMKKREYDLD